MPNFSSKNLTATNRYGKDGHDMLETKSEEKDADILEHYGDVLFQIGKKEEALLFWKKAIKAGSTSALIKEKIDEKKYME